MTETGGKTVFGATMGILMLETRFPRVHGDIGNALTWPFPVQYRIVRGATPDNIVRGDSMAGLDNFIAAGRELVASGCDGIATNCGFLVPLQDKMSEALGVPVASSSLMQVPFVQRMLPHGRKVGIVTISRGTLGPVHLKAAGISPDTPIIGTDEGKEFTQKVLGDAPEIDFEQACKDVVDASVRLCRDTPEVGAIVLECTNMVPYARDVRRATGRPVFSIYSYIRWFQAALMPRKFDLELDDPLPGHNF